MRRTVAETQAGWLCPSAATRSSGPAGRHPLTGTSMVPCRHRCGLGAVEAGRHQTADHAGENVARPRWPRAEPVGFTQISS